MRTNRLDLQKSYADFLKQTYYISLMDKNYTNGYARVMFEEFPVDLRSGFGRQSQGTMGYKIMIFKIV